MVTPFGSVRRNACRKPCIQAPAPVRVGSGESCDASAGLARKRRHSLRYGYRSPIEDPRDAIIKVTSCAICGSDLHLFHNLIPAMLPGDIMGHEMMGEVVEVGSGVDEKLKVGERIVVPFTIICGECEQCKRGNFSVCETTNRKSTRRQDVRPSDRRPVRLHAPDRRLSRRAGGIFASRSPTRRISRSRRLTDEQVLFLGDIFPTGWQAAVHCDIEPTDTVAIWGCGPVGQMAIRSAVLLGREAGGRHRSSSGASEHGRSRRRDSRSTSTKRASSTAERSHRRQRTGEMHRRNRHGSHVSDRSPTPSMIAQSR